MNSFDMGADVAWLEELTTEIDDRPEFAEGYNRYGHEDLSSYAAAFAEGMQAFRVKDPLNFPDWADKHYFLAPDSSGMAGPWVTSPYQRGMMLVMGSDACQHVVVQKPARVGYTKMISGFYGFNVERRKRSLCIWQPTLDDSDGFVQDEIDPLFEYVPVLRDALIVDYRKDKDPRNTNSRKKFLGAVAHFKPGKSAKNYRRITVDIAIIDEADAFDHNIKGTDGKTEGSPIELARVRITASMFKKMVVGSTPTIKGASLIETEMEHVDCVLERYVPCKGCGHYQTLKWGEKDSPYGMKWEGANAKSAKYMCEACGHMHRFGDLTAMDEAGYWASDELRLDDSGDGQFFFVRSGEPAAFPESVGFMFNTLLSPWYSWAETTRDFLKASAALKLGDHTKLQTFYNTRLGLCYELHESQKLDPTSFLSRREYYDADVPLPVVAMTAGIDVQGDRIEVEFKGWGRGEECWAIRYSVLIGNTSMTPQLDVNGIKIPGTPETIWCKLDQLLNTPFKHESGTSMTPVLVCIDSGYCATEVYQFCRRNPTRYIPVKGKGGGTSVPMVTFPSKRNTTGVFLTIVGTDNLQDALHARYQIPIDGPGRMHWPIRNRGAEEIEREDFSLNYFTQMLAETRVGKMSQGRKIMTWVCDPNASNETTDTNKYNLAAIRIAQDFAGVNLNQALVQYEGAMEDADNVTEEELAELAASLNR